VLLRLEAGVANWFNRLKADLVQSVGCEGRSRRFTFIDGIDDSVSVWLLAEK